MIGRSVKQWNWAATFLVMTAAACVSQPHPAPAEAGAQWPTFMGDNHRAPFATERVPADSPQTLWSTSIGSGLRGMPIVTDEVIIAATTDRYIYVISSQDGSTYWRQRLDGPPVPPLISGDRIYAVCEAEGKLRVLRLHDGKKLGEMDLPSVAVPISLRDRMLYVASERGTLLALDPEHHRRVWQVRFRQPPVAGPVVTDDHVVYVTADSLHLVDRATGQRLRSQESGARIKGEVAVGDGALYAAAEDGSLVSWSLPDLQRRWRATGFQAFDAGPVVTDRGGFAATSSGQVIEFDPASGSARILVDLHAAVTAPPVVVAEGLLVGTLEGRLRLVDWNGRTLWTVDLRGSIGAPAYVHAGRIFVPMYGPVEGPLGAEVYRGKLTVLR